MFSPRSSTSTKALSSRVARTSANGSVVREGLSGNLDRTQKSSKVLTEFKLAFQSKSGNKQHSQQRSMKFSRSGMQRSRNKQQDATQPCLREEYRPKSRDG